MLGGLGLIGLDFSKYVEDEKYSRRNLMGHRGMWKRMLER